MAKLVWTLSRGTRTGLYIPKSTADFRSYLEDRRERFRNELDRVHRSADLCSEAKHEFDKQSAISSFPKRVIKLVPMYYDDQ